MTTTETSSKPLTLTLENGTKIELSTAEIGAFEKQDFDQVPVLDLKDINSPDLEKRQALAKALRHVASTVGFFYIKNHQIPQELVDRPFNLGRKFFELPLEEKMKVWTGLFPEGEYLGYHPLGKYNKAGNKYKDLYEAFNINYDPSWDPVTPPTEKAKGIYPNMWPESMPEFEEALMRYQGECLTLGRKMMSLVALSFGLDEDYFKYACEAPSGGLRVVHYPVQEHTADEQNGIGPHTDFQVLTFLNPGEVSGLQVINKRGQWIEVPPIPGHLIVNVGDQLQRVTNGQLTSTVHRVVNNKSGKDRYSIPFFLGFDNDFVMNPLPGSVTEQTPLKYPEIVTSFDYVAWRSRMAKSGKMEKLENSKIPAA